MSQAYTILLLFVSLSFSLFSQEQKEPFFFDVNYFYGTILRHNKDISHLIKDHPEGIILGYHRKTFGKKPWQEAYNYPDYGFSFVFQDSNNNILGNTFGIYGHYNFYFFQRKLSMRIAQGVAYNTNPFHLDKNPKNNAYGTHLLSTTYFMLHYNSPLIFKNFKIQAGLNLVHFSNANVKAPNSSTNSISVHLGMRYEFEAKQMSPYIVRDSFEGYAAPIHLNVVLRGGVNESDYIGLGQHPFAVISTYADKRLNFYSSIHLGTEAFFSTFLKREIEFISIAYPNRGVSGNEDYRRVGLFAGHELHLNRMSVVSQFGYYVYYPYNFEGRTYIRAGLKYTIDKNLFGVATLKSHGAKAEAIEFGMGIRI